MKDDKIDHILWLIELLLIMI